MQWVLSGKVRPGGFVVHDPCQGNAAANDCGEGVDAAHRCAEGNTNQSLLRRIGEPESFLFGNHIEIVASIFPPHALHFVFIQAGNQRAVTVIMAGIIEYTEKSGDAADADGCGCGQVDFPQKIKLCKGAWIFQRNLIK